MDCTLCPHNCHAGRQSPQEFGRCHAPAGAVVSRAAPHFWEEPCISGTKGSGTVFFAGCNLGCVYCQNHAISRNGLNGQAVTPQQLRKICLSLKEQGVHNINFVTPTHVSHVLEQVLAQPLGLPVVYNCSGYEKVETLRRLAGKVQIYLPDLKYMDPAVAAEYSHAPDYPAVATAAIAEMVRQTGGYELDENGLLVKGVLIRHMILPMHTKNTLAVIDWVASTFPPDTVLFSLMCQYTPTPQVAHHRFLHRPITQREYDKCLQAMEAAGLTQGYVQEPDSVGEGYIPDFDCTGVLAERAE